MQPTPIQSNRRSATRDDGVHTGLLSRLLSPLASLKLTVACFLAAIVIVLVGTLAQVNDDIWKVVRDYFRVDFQRLFTSAFPWFHPGELLVWVDPKLFFPPAFFPSGAPKFSPNIGFWFPKGWAIGAVMLLNLLAAHSIRFRVQAKGGRLIAGWIVIALGTLITLAVILSGSNPDGLQSDPIVSYSTLWWLAESTLFGLCAVSIYATLTAPATHPERRWLFGSLSLILLLAALLALQGDGSNESTMRILYQVMKATFASGVLLAGCVAVFKKRAGIVLLHAGICLMMSYDVLVGTEHVESQMHILEGQTTNFSRDLRDVELAVIDHSDPQSDQVTVLKSSLFHQDGRKISRADLPFTIEVLDYYPNSTLLGPRQPVPEGAPKENPATAGMGTQIRAVKAEGATGTDTASRFDVPSAYLRLEDKNGKDLGTYLASAHFDLNLDDNADEVIVDGKKYDLALRFKRLYNNYSVTLKDVQQNDYMGTDRPRDYSSFIILDDPARGTKFEHRIWMNNPMRYGGKTFYQSGYSKIGSGEMTTLQVVDNAGWMTPYVACMMVVVGMIFHFGQTLLRFLNRRMRDAIVPGGARPVGTGDQFDIAQTTPAVDRQNQLSWIVTLAVVAVVALSVGKAMLPAKSKAGEFHLQEFGALPMWYKGRPMPLDTFARNTMLQFSDYQRFTDQDGKKQPAIVWLINLMTDDEKARDLRVIRIENEEVRKLIGLENRQGMTYSINELHKSIDKLIENAQLASAVPAKQRTLMQRKIVELANRLVFFGFLERTLGDAPPLPVTELPESADQTTRIATRANQYLEYLRGARESIKAFSEQYGLGPMPLIVPTHLGMADKKRPNLEELNSKWESVMISQIYKNFYGEFPAPTPPAIELFTKILADYKAGDVKQFNSDLDDYKKLLKEHSDAVDLPVAKVDFEAWYNRNSAFDVASYLYVFAGVLALIGWLCWPKVFERSAFWLLVLIFVMHTFALAGRIYISGRPPVTNLYSSAVFIGWAVVLGGLIIESLTRIGIGNVVAAVAGFLTLRIAAGLAADGDTFVVLEAVLDTQFWLATHVVCIALGYATTYLAGMFGVMYILLGVFTPGLTPKVGKELIRMIYGVLCFATFFSFWGTVLGGLWADDSWGRFWGWDPKENGALIIVLWNALVLHARWGKLAGDRGVAILSVLGNVVVSWSWFGVNELGVGLHSYGFTEGRLMYLAIFALSQLALASVALLPLQFWRSGRHFSKLPVASVSSVKSDEKR